jgi:hypothetical protein
MRWIGDQSEATTNECSVRNIEINNSVMTWPCFVDCFVVYSAIEKSVEYEYLERSRVVFVVFTKSTLIEVMKVLFQGIVLHMFDCS